MDLPYNSIGAYYKTLFNGVRAQKIPVTIATDCPNRRGLKKMEACIFCDEWGSAAYPNQQGQKLKTQIADKIVTMSQKYPSSIFLAYYQSYTNTFLGVQKIRESFEIALSFPQIKGLIIGTRPDCLSPALFDLWNEFSKRCHVAVELGVQSFFDDDLEFLKRGHTATASTEAIYKIKAKTNVDLGIHLIFGLPGESSENVIRTSEIVSKLPVDNVKLHNLHVLKNTGLETKFLRGEFKPVDLETYSDRVILFLEHLDPRIRIQRLAALSSRWDELVAPEWTKHKLKSSQYIINKMKALNTFQGAKFNASSQPLFRQDQISHGL